MAVRTCVGCRESGDRRADDLVRLVLSPDGDIVVDLGGKLPGRGAWVHTRLACLERVAKRPQSLRLGHRPSGMDALPAVIRTRVVAAALDGLSMAQAAGALVSGGSGVVDALQRRGLHSVIVAEDASARTIESAKSAASEDVSFVVLPISAHDLGVRIGRGPRAVIGV